MTAVVSPVADLDTSQSPSEKIESFINGPAYMELLESSSKFNSKLCMDRRRRLLFFDTQTGVAQRPGSLFVHKRNRMPGLLPGQIYSYPRRKWRNNQKYNLSIRAKANSESLVNENVQNQGPTLQDAEDLRVLKELLYAEADIFEIDSFDEPQTDSDLDYEETCIKKKKGRSGRARPYIVSSRTPGRRRGSGRGRGKRGGIIFHKYDPALGDFDQPVSRESVTRGSNARHQRRPRQSYTRPPTNSTYRNVNSTKEKLGPTVDVNDNTCLVGEPFPATPTDPIAEPDSLIDLYAPQNPTSSNLKPEYQDSFVSFLNNKPVTPKRRGRRPSNQMSGAQEHATPFETPEISTDVIESQSPPLPDSATVSGPPVITPNSEKRGRRGRRRRIPM